MDLQQYLIGFDEGDDEGDPEDPQRAGLLPQLSDRVQVDDTLPPGTIKLSNEHGSVTINNLKIEDDPMAMDQDYLYEIETAYWQLILDVQDLFVTEHLGEMERIHLVREKLKRHCREYKDKEYYFMRSERMNE